MSLFPDYIAPIQTNTLRPTLGDLEAVATDPIDVQLTVTGEGEAVPIIYGQQRIGAKITAFATDGDDIYVVAMFCLGEVQSIDYIILDNVVASSEVVSTYLGTTTQTPDPTMQTVIVSYHDDLVVTRNGDKIGMCYAVLKINPEVFPSRIEAVIKGMKVYDPRGTPTTAYSTNPALCLADLITHNVYGQNKTVNWASVGNVADDNDELVPLVTGDKRRELNIAIMKNTKTSKHIEALRAYAACFVITEGDEIKLISDRPASVSRNIEEKDIVAGSLKIKKAGTSNIPTKVTVVYTNTAGNPWFADSAYSVKPGVENYRESIIRLPGIISHRQANREATERLNIFNLSDLTVTWEAFDESAVDQIGDVITLSYVRNLSTKKLRIIDIQQSRIGRYKIIAVEYDEAIYSDRVETEPTYSDSEFPSPANPPTVANLTVVEEVFQQGTGVYASRLRVSWDADPYPYIVNYRVIVSANSKIVFETNTNSAEVATGAVLELVQHDISVSINSGLAYGTPATHVITPLGKYLAPGDVTNFTGFEAGGTVFLTWDTAIDIDIWKYEIRYGVPSVTWDNAVIVDRTDSLRLRVDGISEGTYDFLIKAVDSVNNRSDTEASIEIVISSDSGSFLVDSYTFVSPTLTNMFEYTLGKGTSPQYAVSESTETWNAIFTNNMSTYTESLFYYQASIVSEYLTETWDAGLILSGDWIAELDYTDINGTVTVTMELSEDDSTWYNYTTLSQKAKARYARLRVKTDTGIALVNWPVAKIKINAIPKTENGSDTSSSTALTEIQLNSEYSAVKAITITPLGTDPVYAVVDAIDLTSSPNTFDVYIFSDSTTQVQNDFLWKFEGV